MKLTQHRGNLTTGIVVHELLHALGLWHQQSAKDRDTYVKVYPERIRPQNLFNFDRLQATNNYVGYSFGSIMHYGRTAFGITQGVNVMEALDPNGKVNNENTLAMGQRTQLDMSDAIELQIMYHCHIANPTAGLVANAPPQEIKNLCSAQCQCAEKQGGCTADTQCQGDLYCAAAVGAYEHLGQRAEVPGLNACLLPAMKPTFAPVTGGPVGPSATTAPIPDLLSTAKPTTQAPSPAAIPGAPTPFDLTIGNGDGKPTIIPAVPQQVGPFTVSVQAIAGTMTMELSMQGEAGWMSVAFGAGHAGGTDSVTCAFGATPAAYDTYSGNGRAHYVDATQDTTLISATVAGGISKCSFSRALTTGDATDTVLNMDVPSNLAVAYGTGAVTAGAGETQLQYNQHPAGGFTSAPVTISAAKVSDGDDDKVAGSSGSDSTAFIAVGSVAGLIGVAGVATAARRRAAAADSKDEFYAPPVSYNQHSQGQQQMGYYPQQSSHQQMASANPMYGMAL
jgi:hypothetical protein